MHAFSTVPSHCILDIQTVCVVSGLLENLIIWQTMLPINLSNNMSLQIKEGGFKSEIEIKIAIV